VSAIFIVSETPKMSGALSKLGPAGQDLPAKKEMREVVFHLIRAGAMGLLTFYLVRWALRHADPTYQQKQKAKIKAKELMERLGVKDVALNEYEVMIASHLVDPNHLKVSWDDVAGLDDVIEQLKKTVIFPVLAQQKVTRMSRLIQPPKGVLLYGPPGCGKTLIAKAMAKEAKCWFINLDVSVLTDKWYGESQKLTAAVFSLAEKLQPCIIFIDEIDSLLRLRATQDHEVTAMMKAQFMSLWDGLITDPRKTVIVMGATNRPKDMDTAILRRMAAKFHIPSPDLIQRKHILDITLRNEILAAEFDIDELAKLTDGFSGSDLKEVARSAAVSCLADLQLSSAGDSVSIPGEIAAAYGDSTNTTGWLSWLRGSRETPEPISSSVSEQSLNAGQRSMSLRPITMRDFKVAIQKAKESRAHCGTQVLNRHKLELD
jgi:SpoVK/Ycf46/Vps4 family AAA+-type ATPase